MMFRFIRQHPHLPAAFSILLVGLLISADQRNWFILSHFELHPELGVCWINALDLAPTDS